MSFAVSHIGIAVPSITEASRKLRATIGVAAGEIQSNDAQGVRVAYVDLPGGRIELLEPTSEDSPIGRFLKRNPSGGIHHFSLAAPDLDAAIATLAGEGVALAGPPGRNVNGDRIAFVHPRDFLGVLLELEEYPQALVRTDREDGE